MVKQLPLLTLADVSSPSRPILDLAQLAKALGAGSFGGPLSAPEAALLQTAANLPDALPHEVDSVRQEILAGLDPLGVRLAAVRSQGEKREIGQFLTPPEIVDPMVAWVMDQSPRRVIDCGAGTGRFGAAVYRSDPTTEIIAIDLDPIACLLCRAHLAQLGANARVICDDFTRWDPEPTNDKTVYLGNPPYVRHHSLTDEQKDRASAVARALGLRLSRLAGLHVHFVLHIAQVARSGDTGCIVTSAEWLDVNYGAAVRNTLLTHLGLESLHMLAADTLPFLDAMTTAVITTFKVGQTPEHVRVRTVNELQLLDTLQHHDRIAPTHEFRTSERWSQLLYGTSGRRHDDQYLVPLKQIARVHRGVATGANRFFSLSRHEAHERGIEDHCIPVISRAKEIIASNGTIRAPETERVVLAIPPHYRHDELSPALQAYVSWGEEIGVDQAYNCRNRRPWWSLGHIRRPPIVMTYMARRPPVFALNPDGLPLLNIAHGIYPNEQLNDTELATLVSYLNDFSSSFTGNGRTYHGGLEKFEPSEVEALMVPPKELLATGLEVIGSR